MLINKTPHPIHIYSQDTPARATEAELKAGLLASIPPEGPPARLGMIELGTWHYEDAWAGERAVPVGIEAVEYHHVDNLPEPQPGVRYIVSLPVALACTPNGRDDLVSPFLEVRNEEGTMVGCKMLARPV